MKRLKYVSWGCVMVVFTMTMTGCASFKRHQLPEVGSLPSLQNGTTRPNASYEFSSGIEVFGKQEHPEKIRAQLEREFLDVLNESGYFAVLTKGDNGEMRIKIRLVNSGNPAVILPGFITGFSLFTIPSWATDKFTASVKVTTSDSKEYAYELCDCMTTVMWLPMIVVAPFKNIITVPREVRKNIWKNLLLRMQQDGVLPRATSTGPMSSLEIRIVLSVEV